MGVTNKKAVKKEKDKGKQAAQEVIDKKKSRRQSSLHDSLSLGAALKYRAVVEEEARNQRSILRQKLERLATQISSGGLVFSTCIVIMMIARFCLKTYSLDGEPFEGYHFNYYVYYFIVGVTLLVVAVPEGLPLAITLSFAYSTRQVSFN
jgi:magnesium-transporting ATPase (P-type)